ncbi:MAG: hypothetical protein QE271_13495 [Bacteriovoracaceae bacterium]|nr:hypothetical protein [Bacteriovoracaceae bacterium]
MKILITADILLEKWQFFLQRFVLYFGFLLIPLWINRIVEISPIFQLTVLLLYIVFLFGQFYLLAKEVDHRLKISVRAQSSTDRILYRLVIGQSFFLIYFFLLNYIPEEIYRHFFWATWAAMGLFYSWPTRGKIIQEGLSTDLNEFRFLDGFEKTILVLLISTCILSIPSIPKFESFETLRLYLDPTQRLSDFYFHFVGHVLFPFTNFPSLYFYGWNVYLYLFSTTVLLLSSYCLFRFFFSRRLSLLGLYAIISSWAFSKTLQNNYYSLLVGSFAVLYIWSLYWASRAGNYRSGLIVGSVLLWGVWIDHSIFLLWPITVVYFWFWGLRSSHAWFKQHFYKYTLFSFIVSLLVLLDHGIGLKFSSWDDWIILKNTLIFVFLQKSFLYISIVGIGLLILTKFYPWIDRQAQFLNQENKFTDLIIITSFFLVLGLLFYHDYISSYLFITLLTFFSLVPLEILFRNLQSLRSQRNLIFVTYILICLFDSHLEGRVKILINGLAQLGIRGN